MVPSDLLSFAFAGDEIVPRYFLERDHVWLRALLDEYARFEGKSRRELRERLAAPLPMAVPLDKLRIARHVLDGTWRFETRAAVEPQRARATLFGEAGRTGDRQLAICRAAEMLGVEGDAMVQSLFADLPYERIVTPPRDPPNPAVLAQRANLALVGGMLKRSVAVSIEGGSDLRAVVRQAKLRGLLCTIRQRSTSESRDRLEVSGPYALFRRTLLYGRALSTLVPFAAHCLDMELRAVCVLEGMPKPRTLVVRSGDPLFPAPAGARCDSKLEERFLRDFAKAAPEWDVIREPAAIPVDGTLIFPDFELRHRRDADRRWLVEIVGFWTPEYVDKKLRRLRQAALPRLILCLDDERNCGADELPADAQVIRYKRRIDPEEVLAIIDHR